MTEKSKPKIVKYHQMLMEDIALEIKETTEKIYDFDTPQLYMAIQSEKIKILEKLINYLDVATDEIYP